MNIHQVPEIDVRAKLAALEGQDIKDPSEWEVRKRILDRHKDGKALDGFCLPWSRTHEKVRLRRGELSVWAGFNAHNKSTVLSQVATWVAQETKVGIGSFEMELEDTYNLMAKQAGGTAQPDSRWVNDFCTWSEDRIFVYDRLEAVPADQVLSGVDYMADTLKCGLVVIDSLMMCRGVVGDSEREANFISTLVGLAKYYHIHIAIAHHMRKPQHGDESYIPNKFDLKGSGGISDLAHTLFICWNNKALKELNAKVSGGIPLTQDEQSKYNRVKEKPEQLLIVAKQRHGSFEGGVGLWQHESRQFTEDSRKRPQHINIPRLAA